MEDSHIANIQFDGKTGLFGVFDGHGGVEVAQFVKRNYEQVLLENTSYKA
jgi:serine/threonine protein phosphatase PrpC